ncbi:MAG TPA: glutamate racemase [Smithella sp.]|jgi:glutamate racemase|nr:glutamate racemase [Smithella sp.]NMC96743.1 glutamate racemase [Deltaproteobacteria bacterium]OQC54435.1 MAG: Glutamate racemase [Deltaproteobacteria bacterium ADurb.Bin022]HNQ65863.1 glutamate racemase [Smithella sp.]HOE32437.1 glutamate racemase [Smithella sp.]
MNTKANRAIGVFDSGIGGLTVVRALMERLPFENIIYFGDTARVPYGVKSVETINRYAAQITEFLIQKDVKMLIVACNTMAAVAHQTIIDLSQVPVAFAYQKLVEQVPVLEVIDASARMAIQHTKTKSIGVIGTPATVNSNAYARAIHLLDKEAKVFSHACPLFVPLVEEGWFDHPATKLIAQEYLKQVIAEQVDTLVLGCTHYPLLKPLLQDIMGKSVTLIDSAEAMAGIAADLIDQQAIGNQNHAVPEYTFYVSDLPYRFQTIGERFLGRTLGKIELVSF